jgi:ribosomal protein S3AE
MRLKYDEYYSTTDEYNMNTLQVNYDIDNIENFVNKEMKKNLYNIIKDLNSNKDFYTIIKDTITNNNKFLS